MDYVSFRPLLFLFVGFLGFLWQGERFTVSKGQSGQINTHTQRANLKPQPHLFLTGCNLTLPHPQKVSPGWVWQAE